MIKRTIESKLIEIAKKISVVGILGPRQAGKTTTAKAVFKDHHYVSLENLDERDYALTDPKGFLKTNHNGQGLIIDEIQYWLKITNSSQKGLIVYGGDSDQMRNNEKILSWKKINLIYDFIQMT